MRSNIVKQKWGLTTGLNNKRLQTDITETSEYSSTVHKKCLEQSEAFIYFSLVYLKIIAVYMTEIKIESITNAMLK